MKKMIVMALGCCFMILNSAPVDQETASAAARNWFSAKSGKNHKPIENVYTRTRDGVVTLYTFAFKDGGFVIIAGDDQISPVLGYSPISAATEKTDYNPALNDWLDNYSKAVVIANKRKTVNKAANKEWQQILNNDFSSQKDVKAVEPLVKAMFNQDSPYDMYTPFVPNTTNHCAVGCVATAMSMVMSYYHWPHTGNGSYSYYDSGSQQTLSANFGATTYDWSRILNENNSNSPLGAREMVAKLSSHAGIAARMRYGASSASGISYALTAFKSYFRMKSTANIKYRDSFTDANWKQLVKTELETKRPLYYRGADSEGAGHAFVCDGYLTNTTTDRFHFNWGWGGSYNGYFLIDSLVPSGSGIGGGSGDYSVENAAIFDLLDYSAAPSAITGMQVFDKGTGTELLVKWNKSSAADHKNYRVRVGTSTYNYTASYPVDADTVYTIQGLTAGTQYFIAVTELDQENDESPVVEKIMTPNLLPVPPVNLKADALWQKIKVSWNRNNEMDLAGYDLYKSTDGNDYVKVNSGLITDTTYIEENPAHNAYTYYKVRAVDALNNQSAMSEAVTGRPVTLNQGVVIIDESANGAGTAVSPDDAMQDQFYNSITSHLVHKSHYDANAAGKISLSEMGPYSTVIWHNQSVELASVFSTYQSEIKKYLDFGGKMLIVADKPGKLVEGNNSYPANYLETSVAQTYFGIDSAFYKPASRCNGANALISGYNDLVVDTTKTTVANNEHLKKLETLRAADGATVIYDFDTIYEITDTYGTEKGRPLGVEKLTSGFKTITLAMPLYFVKETDAQKLIDYVMSSKFGEEVGIIDDGSGQIKGLTILGNYPNPFNPVTDIRFYNPAAGLVKVSVYNAKGEMVSEIMNKPLGSGTHSISFNAASLNSGVYIYKITTPERSVAGKMILLK